MKKQDISGYMKEDKKVAYDGGSSQARVQRSSHSGRIQRENPKTARYKPYAATRDNRYDGRTQHKQAERTWKEKQLPPLKIADTELNVKEARRSGSTCKVDSNNDMAAGSSSRTDKMKMTESHEPVKDANATFRTAQSSQSMDAIVDSIIPPYDALKIDALTDVENDQSLDEQGDDEMNEVNEVIVGNELMLMEEDDLLGEDLLEDDLESMKAPGQEGRVNSGVVDEEHDRSVLMIEANPDEKPKTVTRSISKSLFPSEQRRASPRINAKATMDTKRTESSRRRGHQQAMGMRGSKSSTTNLKKGSVDAKDPPHLHQ